MPFLPLKEKPFRNVDSVGNSSAIDYVVDVVKDDFMNNKGRVGLGGSINNTFVDLGTVAKVDGLFRIKNYSFAAAFSDGRLFKLQSSGVATEITGAQISSGYPVYYADFGDVGYFCNNSKILKWTYTDATCSFIADAQAPSDATHLAFIDSYLVALRAGAQRFEWSEVDNPDSWLGEFASAETRPDDAVALHGHFGELFIPGTTTIEHWTTTGDTSAPFQRIPGAVGERGCLAPHSVAQIDNTYFFLDDERKVIRLAGRVPQVISNPYDSQFQALNVVSDARGFHFNTQGYTFYVLNFPTAGKTYAYDYKLDYWTEFSYWNGSTRESWLGNCGVYMDQWNKYLVGSRVDGKIYLASSDYITDNGATQISELWTGNIDWQTNKRKSSTRLRIKVKRGNVAIGSSAEQLRVSWRDDGNTEWSPERVIDLGIAGDTEAYKTIRRLGCYMSRQWRFRINGNFYLVSAEEDVTGI